MPEQDDYISLSTEEHSVEWLKELKGTFAEEWVNIKERLNAQFHNRGKNIAMECLQFGGNSEFWSDFPSEKDIAIYFQRCYAYAIRYVGYLSTDKNIICALKIKETNRRNLFVYYLPITDKWQVKVMSDNVSKRRNKLQAYDNFGMPIYKEVESEQFPLLCHSEFWKQRGNLSSYPDLQEDFYQKISRRYGAVRGESYSLIKNTNEEQQNRFSRYKGDDNDFLPPIKGIWI